MRVSTPRRGVTAALAIALGTTGLIALTAAPAAAGTTSQYAEKVQTGWTDKADPATAFNAANDVNMPLGSRTDEAGVVHTSRIYATFDLTPFQDKHLIASTLRFKEYSAADCSKRAIEIWRTKAVDATPTWSTAPHEIAKLDESLTPEFCPAYLSSDMVATVAQVLAEGKRKLTIEIRVPAALEADPSYGRLLNWYNSVSLGVTYNSPPKVDDRHMYNAGFACRTTAPYQTLGSMAGYLEGVVTDADYYDERRMTAEFAVWPVADPGARTVYTTDRTISGRVAGVLVPREEFTTGQEYAWQYRVSDGTDTSDWSKTCHFLVDRTAPSAPAVTSPNYPTQDVGQTPIGVPGKFTFDGHGDTDIAGFSYGWESLGVPGGCPVSGDYGQLVCAKPFSGTNTVRADVPGGTATIRLSPPRYGWNTLVVRSVDVAGNVSAEVTYQISVPVSDPIVTLVGGDPEWNKPVTLKFSPQPGVKNVQSYTYKINSNPEQTVAADADGTATVTFTASSVDGPSVTVRSTSANGFVSSQGWWAYTFYPWPGVTSDVYIAADWQPHGGVGVPGTFTFTPPPGEGKVVSYMYSFNWGEYLELPADADGKATVTWAPDASDINTLDVWAVYEDGSWSQSDNIYQFLVG